MHSEEGTDSSPCPFVVHALTGEQHDAKLPNELKAIAMQYWVKCLVWVTCLSYNPFIKI